MGKILKIILIGFLFLLSTEASSQQVQYRAIVTEIKPIHKDSAATINDIMLRVDQAKKEKEERKFERFKRTIAHILIIVILSTVSQL